MYFPFILYLCKSNFLDAEVSPNKNKDIFKMFSKKLTNFLIIFPFLTILIVS